MAFPADVLINKASEGGEKSGEKCVTGALETWEVGLVVALLLIFGLFGLFLLNLLATYVSVKCLSLRLFLPQLGVWLCCVHTVTLLRNLLLYIMHLKSPPEMRERAQLERDVMSRELEREREMFNIVFLSLSLTANQYCI